jgi:hypothetical protein
MLGESGGWRDADDLKEEKRFFWGMAILFFQNRSVIRYLLLSIT